jgi:hypothetical protein
MRRVFYGVDYGIPILNPVRKSMRVEFVHMVDLLVNCICAVMVLDHPDTDGFRVVNEGAACQRCFLLGRFISGP